MKTRIGISGRLARNDHDDSTGPDARGEPQEGGAFVLTQKGQPNNDSIESVMGNEGVAIRGDKPRPIALTGNCRAPLCDIDDFRRLVDSDHQPGGAHQLGDPERYVAGAAAKIENTHAALYAGPPHDVFGKVRQDDDPKSQWPHLNCGITQLGGRSACCCCLHIEHFRELTRWSHLTKWASHRLAPTAWFH